MSPVRLWAIVLKELRQLRRDRITLAMIIGIPTLQLLLFGFAINLNVRDLPTAVVDEAGTARSRALVEDLLATGVVRRVQTLNTPDAAMDALRRGEVGLAVLVPHDLERRLAEGREAVQVVADGSDNSLLASANQLAQVPVVAVASSSGGGARQAPIKVLGLYNPERRSAVNIVPALVGLILTMTMVMFTAISIVRERERGNLELLITTPMSRLELMAGKILPYVAIGLVQASVVFALGVLVFDVPNRGSWLDAYVATTLVIVANLALGLLISTRATSQFQAMQMSFFLMLPSILLSGFMFPFDGMPRAAQWIAEILPLTHFVRLIRGIMLREASLLELWPDALALVAFSAIVMGVAVARFSKRLD